MFVTGTFFKTHDGRRYYQFDGEDVIYEIKYVIDYRNTNARNTYIDNTTGFIFTIMNGVLYEIVYKPIPAHITIGLDMNGKRYYATDITSEKYKLTRESIFKFDLSSKHTLFIDTETELLYALDNDEKIMYEVLDD